MNEESTTSQPSVPSEPTITTPLPPQKEHFFAEIIKFIFFALIIVLPIRLFVAQPFIVSGASMDPGFETGQYLIVNQLNYQFSNPQRGEVVIFKYPKDLSKYFIKRVIGLPGETVIIEGSTVTIKNSENPNGFTLDEPYIASNNFSEDSLTKTLGDDEYFVLGDNRRLSSDSRAWGPVPRNDIVGTPFIRLFPFNQISVNPGDYQNSK